MNRAALNTPLCSRLICAYWVGFSTHFGIRLRLKRRRAGANGRERHIGDRSNINTNDNKIPTSVVVKLERDGKDVARALFDLENGGVSVHVRYLSDGTWIIATDQQIARAKEEYAAQERAAAMRDRA
jgi:hypothetical protein